MPPFQYETIQGVFAQSNPSTDEESFDFMASGFGLIRQTSRREGTDSESLSDWHRLAHRLRLLNSTAPGGTCYKALFIARHGQGVHNVAESRYGTVVWDENFSKRDGADGLHWSDAVLTELGEQQARDVARTWALHAASDSMPTPQSFYCSPLIRCLQTARFTHAGREWEGRRPERYQPVVKEFLRETNGVHTCDRRSPRSRISALFPEAIFEDGFAESDELWSASHREQWWEQDARLKLALDEIFATDPNIWISITCHSGASRAILKNLGHRPWKLQPGEVIPVIVKASRDQ